MAQSDFSISITDEAVDISHTPSLRAPRGKIAGLVFAISTSLVLFCAVLFLPDKNGSSIVLRNLTQAPSSSGQPYLSIAFLVFLPASWAWWGLRFARVIWPSDETLHCDHEAMTVSRIPWLDFSHRTWRTKTYPLSEVKKIRFAVIASNRNKTYYGLRFSAHGRVWVLPGLEAPEAKPILMGLRALGADVPDDPKLDKRVRQALEIRGDTSWMDKTWVNPTKK
jgi:hypothetical protein